MAHPFYYTDSEGNLSQALAGHNVHHSSLKSPLPTQHVDSLLHKFGENLKLSSSLSLDSSSPLHTAVPNTNNSLEIHEIGFSLTNAKTLPKLRNFVESGPNKLV